MLSPIQHTIQTPVQTLLQWLAPMLPPQAYAWLEQQLTSSDTPRPLKDFYLAFGQAPRRIGKQPLSLTAANLQAAQELRAGFTPAHWTTDQTARTLLLLTLPDADVAVYLHTLEQLFTTAEVGEWVALYQALPLLSHPEKLIRRASEGIRTSIDVVFNAIALDNPYPMEYLPEEAWNQMILKAVFIGSPLHRIQGISTRANATLARILTDYAHERWAAGRAITPLLWQQVAPFVTETTLPDLQRLFSPQSTPAEHQAATLVCVQSSLSAALDLAQQQQPHLTHLAQTGDLTWQTLI